MPQELKRVFIMSRGGIREPGKLLPGDKTELTFRADGERYRAETS